MMLDSANCSLVPSETAADAGIAGAGVLLSFIISAALAIILSTVIILYEFLGKSEAKVLRKLLLSFSDTQILTGIGIQAVALAKLDSIVPYHFFLVWMLSLLATATHLATLLALVNDFKRDWVLRWLRQFLMFVGLVLSCVLGIFVLMTEMRGLQPTLPVACVWNLPPRGPASNAALSVAGTIAVVAGNCIIFALSVWYLHSQKQRFLKMTQVSGLLVLTAIGIGATIRVIMLSQAFGTPSVPLSSSAEKDWSFGQLLPLLLLLLPVVSAIEIIRGEMNVPSPMADDCTPLFEKEGRISFQPNPFWGVRSHFST